MQLAPGLLSVSVFIKELRFEHLPTLEGGYNR
jgi:hypothetical protein